MGKGVLKGDGFEWGLLLTRDCRFADPALLILALLWPPLTSFPSSLSCSSAQI